MESEATVSCFQEIFGESLRNKEGGKVPLSSIQGPGRIIGLYFSAQWCPPCRFFTPQLIKFYKNIKKKETGFNFEIVFFSSDQDEEEFEEYYKEMPWLVVDFKDRQRESDVSKRFEIQGIPTFLLLDGENGDIITTSARLHVSEDPEGKLFPWRQTS